MCKKFRGSNFSDPIPIIFFNQQKTKKKRNQKKTIIKFQPVSRGMCLCSYIISVNVSWSPLVQRKQPELVSWNLWVFGTKDFFKEIDEKYEQLDDHVHLHFLWVKSSNRRVSTSMVLSYNLAEQMVVELIRKGGTVNREL